MEDTGVQTDKPRDLLSSVCHDLREPLASMTMGISLLRRLLSDDNAAAVRVVETLQRAVARMDQRVGSFSDLGRLEAGVLTLDIGSHEIGPIIEAARQQFVADAASRPLTLSPEINAEIAALRLACDRTRLLQTFRNLGACVLRVAPDGSTVSFDASADAEGGVRFEVAVRPSADGRSFTAPLPTPELTIARGLIALHGGLLAVARDPRSLTLTFTVPAPTASGSAG